MGRSLFHPATRSGVAVEAMIAYNLRAPKNERPAGSSLRRALTASSVASTRKGRFQRPFYHFQSSYHKTRRTVRDATGHRAHGPDRPLLRVKAEGQTLGASGGRCAEKPLTTTLVETRFCFCRLAGAGAGSTRTGVKPRPPKFLTELRIRIWKIGQKYPACARARRLERAYGRR